MPEKKTSKTINLPQPYVAPPRLVVGLTSVDMQAGTNLRVQAYADGIDRQKYTAHMDTWADTTLYSGRFDALVLKPANMDILSGQFSTGEDHPWNEPKVKTSRRINFERPFITTPKVVVFLNSFDTGSGSSTRVTTYTSGIDTNGFTIHIDTWSDTTLYSAIAGWVAYPEDKDYIFSGTANTMDARPWQTPQAQTQKNISFQGASFLKKPTIFVALNSIDISAQTNLRIRAYVDNITTSGLTWHIDSWADTKIWSAGISYIAFH
ncbi:hypothetical protein FRC00_001191 [Tulasnella sp. 408]|nr:hypothetical protein FRC00_001191 [Tulasnella sp. 408]